MTARGLVVAGCGTLIIAGATPDIDRLVAPRAGRGLTEMGGGGDER